MTRVTGVGTGAGPRDPALVLQTFSGAIVAIATRTDGSAGVVVVTAIGTMIVIGVIGANGKDNHS